MLSGSLKLKAILLDAAEAEESASALGLALCWKDGLGRIGQGFGPGLEGPGPQLKRPMFREDPDAGEPGSSGEPRDSQELLHRTQSRSQIGIPDVVHRYLLNM